MSLYKIHILAVSLAAAGAAASGQTEVPPLQEQAAEKKSAATAAFQNYTAELKNGAPKDSARAEAYFNYTMGHIYELQYEASSSPEYATRALEAYKRAYELDPKSPVIGERLAEMYWKAQRMREAESEAKEILKRNPDDVPTRRLLGRIYLRSLGDANAGSGQSEAASRAIEQFREINRLDPSDTESSLWLAVS